LERHVDVDEVEDVDASTQHPDPLSSSSTSLRHTVLALGKNKSVVAPARKDEGTCGTHKINYI
jgi:hypothetical protein